jgi:hypothetical protein
MELVYRILSFNKNILLVDGDIVFLQDPMIDILRWRDECGEVWIQNDAQNDKDTNNLCTGYLYLRSSPRIIELYDCVSPIGIEKYKKCAFDNNDQTYFNTYVKPHCKVNALPLDQYPNGKMFYDYLKYVRMEQDRLENISPSILPHIIAKFNIQFKDKDIEKPEITGDLDTVEVNIKHRKGHDYSPTHNNESTEATPNTILKVMSGLSTTVRNKILAPTRNVTIPREENKSVFKSTRNFLSSNRDESVTPPTTSIDSIQVVPKN